MVYFLAYRLLGGGDPAMGLGTWLGIRGHTRRVSPVGLSFVSRAQNHHTLGIIRHRPPEIVMRVLPGSYDRSIHLEKRRRTVNELFQGGGCVTAALPAKRVVRSIWCLLGWMDKTTGFTLKALDIVAMDLIWAHGKSSWQVGMSSNPNSGWQKLDGLKSICTKIHVSRIL